MINKENVLKTTQSLIRQYNLPLKLLGLEEGTEEVTIYFSAGKKVRVRELEQELELQLNLPIKLERIKKAEGGKIGGVDILGKYPCCALFLRKCPFAGKYGCGYGFSASVSQCVSESVADKKPATLRHRTRDTETQKREKRKRKKVVRRVVIG